MNKFARFLLLLVSLMQKLLLFLFMVLAGVSAHAQLPGGIDAALDVIDLSGIAVKIAAAGLLIVGIALAFKGPDLFQALLKRSNKSILPALSLPFSLALLPCWAA